MTDAVKLCDLADLPVVEVEDDKASDPLADIETLTLAVECYEKNGMFNLSRGDVRALTRVLAELQNYRDRSRHAL